MLLSYCMEGFARVCSVEIDDGSTVGHLLDQIYRDHQIAFVRESVDKGDIILYKVGHNSFLLPVE